MGLLEKIANIFGGTTMVHRAQSMCVPYIPKSYIIIGIITIVAAITIATILIQKKLKK